MSTRSITAASIAASLDLGVQEVEVPEWTAPGEPPLTVWMHGMPAGDRRWEAWLAKVKPFDEKAVLAEIESATSRQPQQVLRLIQRILERHNVVYDPVQRARHIARGTVMLCMKEADGTEVFPIEDPESDRVLRAKNPWVISRLADIAWDLAAGGRNDEAYERLSAAAKQYKAAVERDNWPEATDVEATLNHGRLLIVEAAVDYFAPDEYAEAKKD